MNYNKNRLSEGSGIDRYKIGNELLSKASSLNVSKAFDILEAVRQNGGDWQTVFSMVYSKKESKVYYCYNRLLA